MTGVCKAILAIFLLSSFFYMIPSQRACASGYPGNGPECGPAISSSHSSAPTTGLCNMGTLAYGPERSAGNYVWRCSGPGVTYNPYGCGAPDTRAGYAGACTKGESLYEHVGGGGSRDNPLMCDDCAFVGGEQLISYYNCDIPPCGQPPQTFTQSQMIDELKSQVIASGQNPVNFIFNVSEGSGTCPAPGCDAFFPNTFGMAYACPGATPSVVGQCNSSTPESCISGTYQDDGDTGTEFRWTCLGSGGGGNASCTAPKSIPGGVCGYASGSTYSSAPQAAASLCSSGTASGVSGAGPWNWTCTANGITTACSSQTCMPPVNGFCNNSTRNACSRGTADDNLIPDTSTEYKWACKGANGGSDDTNCSIAIPPLANGQCNNSSINGCSAGTWLDKTDDASNYYWSCLGSGGGTDDLNCAMAKVVTPPPQCIPQGQAVPPGQTQCPSNSCFFQVSGVLISDFADVPSQGVTQVGTTDEWSNMVGAGDYPLTAPSDMTINGYGTSNYNINDPSFIANHPFARAHYYTFDAIALGAGTHITLYNGPNFSGGVLFQGNGPLIVNNSIWQNSGVDAYEQSVAGRNGYADGIEQQFANASSRIWSSDDMHSWGGGRSVKVICDNVAPPPPVNNGVCGSDNGRTDMSSAPTNLCASGYPTAPVGSYPWTWTCQGTNSTPNCSATGTPPAQCIPNGQIRVEYCYDGAYSFRFDSCDRFVSKYRDLANCGDPTGCFTADAKILMADRTEKNIADIKVGDMVMSFDKKVANSKLEPRRVTHVFLMEPKQTFEINGVKVTEGHPFMTGTGEMKPIEEMTENDTVVLTDGSVIARGEIKKAGVEKVFNITVEETHSYIANGMRVGNMTIFPAIPDGVYPEKKLKAIPVARVDKQ